MATRLSPRDASRPRAPGFIPGAQWLDEAGAPLLLAAVIAVVTLAAAELAPAHAPDGGPYPAVTAE